MRLVLACLLAAACKDPTPATSPPQRAAAPVLAARPRSATLPPPPARDPRARALAADAEHAWRGAETAGDPIAWDIAAAAFDRALRACTGDCDELAYSALLARKRALAADATLAAPQPRPTTRQTLPPRVEDLIEAADRYAALRPPDDPDGLGAAFIAAHSYNDYGWIDDATIRFANIIHAAPASEVTLYSANLMLDAYNRAERYEDLVTWARELFANPAVMAAHPELKELVRSILLQSLRAN